MYIYIGLGIPLRILFGSSGQLISRRALGSVEAPLPLWMTVLAGAIFGAVAAGCVPLRWPEVGVGQGPPELPSYWGPQNLTMAMASYNYLRHTSKMIWQVFVALYIYLYTYICACVCVCVCAFACVCVCVYIYIYILHRYTYIYIYIYTHICQVGSPCRNIPQALHGGILP